MNIIIIDKFGKGMLKKGVNFVPRKGDNVDWDYKPTPSVISVVAYPSERTLSDYKGLIECKDIDAIILLG